MSGPHNRLLAGMSAAALAAAMTVTAMPQSSAATAVTFYASPSGSGTACSQAAPCSLTGAQSAVRSQLAATSGAAVTVLLSDGTYRPASTWAFGAADSGSAGDPVVWEAAPGAHPVISGANQVTGWAQVGTSGVWSAPVPSGSASRQLYVNGQEAPIASASPSALGFSGSWTGSSTGYSISGDSAANSWFGSLTAAQVAGVEFDYPGGNGSWTESRCRVASYSASAKTLTMDEPCWADATQRSSFSQGSGGLPSMSESTKPALVEDAQALLRPGQWYLNSSANTLYYEPSAGQQVTSLDVELPHLESLLQGAGTLASPLHDVTFSGLQFSYATWNAPSSTAGFADVQSNLHMTGATNQGMCTFSSPAGSCPWGSLTQPLANVSFTASDNITLTGDRFVGLGGAGLSVMYGSSNTLIEGNEFTDIASTAILLGCTYDPLPTDSSEAAGIKQNCTPNASAVSGDTIGTNEILTGTTVEDNIIHNIGTDYSSACGITLLFSRHTTITDNDLYNLPYTGITAGVIQGHVDQASTPQNSTNINEDNTISDNVFHDFMKVRSDGGAIYAEGHQAQYVYESDGKTINQTATLAQGLQATGNIAYNSPSVDFTYYDDAGSEWINWQGNVAFGAGSASQGGCSPTGNFWITGNYFSSGTQNYPCAAPTNSNASGNTTISSTPVVGTVPTSLFAAAGVTSAFSTLAVDAGPQIYYVSPTTSTTTQVLVAGEGFSPNSPVYIGGNQVSGVQYLSSGFLIVPVPAGTAGSAISVGDRVNDTDPSIVYSGFSYSSGRGLGDYQDDIHYATANGSTATLTFSGTGIQVYGEQYTDQGNIGISIDGGTQQTISTLPSDGQRHSNVAVYTATGLASGTHTIVITKLSGQYTTLDGFNVTNIPASIRLNDTYSAITYSGFSYSSGRGYGDYQDDVHYATANGSTATFTFTGTGIQVYGEQYTDQGNIGISIDGGTQQTISTLPSDGQRHANVDIYTATGLSSGSHTIVITKLSGQYTTLDGFAIPNS